MMKTAHLIGSIFIIFVCVSLIITADAQPASALTKTSDMNNISIRNDPGWIYIEGEWIYDDRDSTSTGADRFLVQLLDYYDPDPDNPIDEDLTDSDGHFELSIYDDTGWFKIGIYSYALYGSDEVMVVEEGGADLQDAYQYIKSYYFSLGSNGHRFISPTPIFAQTGP